MNLVVPNSYHQSGSLGVGVEFGGEIALGPLSALRPFVSYEYKQAMFGKTQSVAAGFEGAPAGVAPFIIKSTTDNLHQVSAGVDLIDNKDVNFRFQYTASFGARTRQDTFGIKLAVPF